MHSLFILNSQCLLNWRHSSYIPGQSYSPWELHNLPSQLPRRTSAAQGLLRSFAPLLAAPVGPGDFLLPNQRSMSSIKHAYRDAEPNPNTLQVSMEATSATNEKEYPRTWLLRQDLRAESGRHEQSPGTAFWSKIKVHTYSVQPPRRRLPQIIGWSSNIFHSLWHSVIPYQLQLESERHTA